MMKNNFRAYFEPQDLEALRKLAEQLDFTLANGHRQGDSSPRQLMIALAHAVQKQGVKRAAEAIAPLLGQG